MNAPGTETGDTKKGERTLPSRITGGRVGRGLGLMAGLTSGGARGVLRQHGRTAVEQGARAQRFQFLDNGVAPRQEGLDLPLVQLLADLPLQCVAIERLEPLEDLAIAPGEPCRRLERRVLPESARVIDQPQAPVLRADR